MPLEPFLGELEPFRATYKPKLTMYGRVLLTLKTATTVQCNRMLMDEKTLIRLNQIPVVDGHKITTDSPLRKNMQQTSYTEIVTQFGIQEPIDY